MIAYDTPVFISSEHQGKRYWLTGANNQIHKPTGKLVLQGQWSPDASAARSQKFETAVITRRRLWEESACQVEFRLATGDASPVEPETSLSISGPDERVPLEYKGLLTRPGIRTSTGEKVWYVKLRDPQTGELEPVRGNTPQEVVDLTIDKGLFAKAEKAPAAPAPQTAVQQQPGPRIRVRPGSLPR